MADKSNLVRYQVVAKCFVNGVRHDPARSPNGKPVFVMAAPGLEGKALKRVDAKTAPKPAGKAKNGDKPQQGDQGEPTDAGGDDSAAGK